jgi:hypothetical protein
MFAAVVTKTRTGEMDISSVLVQYVEGARTMWVSIIKAGQFYLIAWKGRGVATHAEFTAQVLAVATRQLQQ